MGIGLALALKSARRLRPVGGADSVFLLWTCSDQARSIWALSAARKRLKRVRRKRNATVAAYAATVVVVHAVKNSVTRMLVEKTDAMAIPPPPLVSLDGAVGAYEVTARRCMDSMSLSLSQKWLMLKGWTMYQDTVVIQGGVGDYCWQKSSFIGSTTMPIIFD